MNRKWTSEELDKLKSFRREGKAHGFNAIYSMLRNIERQKDKSELEYWKEKLKFTQRLLAECEADRKVYRASDARKLGEIEELIKENERLQKTNKKIAYKARLIAIGAVIYVLFSAIYIAGFLYADSKQSEIWGQQ